jgi:hypothetical protein
MYKDTQCEVKKASTNTFVVVRGGSNDVQATVSEECGEHRPAAGQSGDEETNSTVRKVFTLHPPGDATAVRQQVKDKPLGQKRYFLTQESEEATEMPEQKNIR